MKNSHKAEMNELKQSFKGSLDEMRQDIKKLQAPVKPQFGADRDEKEESKKSDKINVKEQEFM